MRSVQYSVLSWLYRFSALPSDEKPRLQASQKFRGKNGLVKMQQFQLCRNSVRSTYGSQFLAIHIFQRRRNKFYVVQQS